MISPLLAAAHPSIFLVPVLAAIVGYFKCDSSDNSQRAWNAFAWGVMSMIIVGSIIWIMNVLTGNVVIEEW